MLQPNVPRTFACLHTRLVIAGDDKYGWGGTDSHSF